MIDTIKDFLGKTFKIYKNNFLKIAAIILLVWIPLVIVEAVIIDPSLDIEGVMEILENQELVGTPEYEDAWAVYMQSVPMYMIMLLVVSFFGLVSDIGVIKITEESHISDFRKISSGFGDVFSESVPLLPRCIWTTILTSLIIAVGLMMFILPGLYVYVMSTLAVSAAVLARVSGLKAIKLSFTIVKNEIFTIFIAIVLFFFAQAAIMYGISVASMLLPSNQIVTAVISSLTTIVGKFITAAQIIFFTVFFKDRYEKISSEHPKDKDPAAEQ